MSKKGFNEKILWIDLSKRSYHEEEIPASVSKLLMGGKGVGVWLLLNRLPVGVDPLSPENILLFTTGPLTGTFAPTSSRFAVITKSPKTGTFLDSYCGGCFGQAIRFMGYNVIALYGVASKLTIVKIDTGKVEFIGAEDISSKSTFETEDYLVNLLGKGWRRVVIGPAGERRNTLAGIFSDGRCAGRGGAGAVMGSKNVKALVLREKGAVCVAKPDAFMRACKMAYRSIRLSSAVRKLSREGTAQLVEPLSRMGGIGTKNFQSDLPEHPEALFPERWWDELWIKKGACFTCPIACGKYFKYKSAGVNRMVDGPDFETIFALGTNCGISNKKAIAKGNYLCDAYGIDTISVGGIIAFLMELYQRGYLKDGPVKALKPEWGSTEAMLSLIELIGEGRLPEIERGVKYISEQFPGSEDFAMHVKGMEFPAYHPRRAPGIGLAYAISDRGACHLRGAPIIELLGLTKDSKPDEEAELVLVHQDAMAVVDCLIVCAFVQYGIGLDYLSRLVEACTGIDFRGPHGLEIVGRRAWDLTRLFNLREGISPEQDTLPKRCLLGNEDQPLDLVRMKKEYYRLLGWSESGYPTRHTLRKLGLDSILELDKIRVKM